MHPIWSVDRDDFIELSELAVGEHLQTASGPLAITSIETLRIPVPVYNIEVRGQHVYEVTDVGILVHNANSCFVQLQKAKGYVPKEYDIVRYGQRGTWKKLRFEKHHGVLNEWAKANIKGFSGGRAPTVVLSQEAHNATRAAFNRWRAANGYSKIPVPWDQISAKEIQKLTYHLFSEAKVPHSVIQDYFRELNQYLYKYM